MQAPSILSQMIAISLEPSQLPPLQNTPPNTMTYLLQTTFDIDLYNQPTIYGRFLTFLTNL
jgi:hypothetical protein